MRHRCFEVTTPAGHPLRIHGNPEMAPETLAALMEMADLAYQQFSKLETETEGETQFVSHLQNNDVRNCAIEGCTGRVYAAHRFCTMHQLRYERTGDPLLARKRGRKGKDRT